jgi:septal ring factor EnvC (AmiA/AmiB activator)
MKKLVLVMVFVVLAAVFIAFNYLLLDRESRENELKDLEYQNSNDKADINAKAREIDSLGNEITSLQNKITQLENDKEQLVQDKSGLAEQKNNSDAALRDKINYLNIIKQYADIKVVSEPLTLWVDALNQGKYEEAYELEYAAVPSGGRSVSLSAYTDEMRKTVKKIEIDEVKIDKLRGSSDGEIFLAVRLTVKLAETADKNNLRFSEGLNEKYIKIGYSTVNNAFMMSSINNY